MPFTNNNLLIYIGMLGILIATGVNYYRNKLHGNYGELYNV